MLGCVYVVLSSHDRVGRTLGPFRPRQILFFLLLPPPRAPFCARPSFSAHCNNTRNAIVSACLCAHCPLLLSSSERSIMHNAPSAAGPPPSATIAALGYRFCFFRTFPPLVNCLNRHVRPPVPLSKKITTLFFVLSPAPSSYPNRARTPSLWFLTVGRPPSSSLSFLRSLPSLFFGLTFFRPCAGDDDRPTPPPTPLFP